MAWYKGNKPEWEEKRHGRILVEAMKAINEREVINGQTETAWDTIGADPDLTDADWYSIGDIGGVWTGEMQQAIEDLLDRPLGSYYHYPRWIDTSWNVYTKASLLTAAGGWGDWSEENWAPTTLVTLIEQVLKCLEKLTRCRHRFVYDAHFVRNKRWDAGMYPVATVAIAHTNCEAMGVGPLRYGPGDHYCKYDAHLIGNGYDEYWKNEEYRKLNQDSVPDSATKQKLQIRLYIGYPYNEVSAYWAKLWKLSAAQYAAPSWGEYGTLMDTFTIPPNTSLQWIDDDVPLTLIDITDQFIYYKVMPQTPSPFSDFDGVTPSTEWCYCQQQETEPVGDNYLMRLYFDPVLTYS